MLGFKKKITFDGNLIKLPNKNQIYAQSEFNETEQRDVVVWVLEQYEHTEKGVDKFSVFDGFHILEDAMDCGLSLNDATYERLKNQRITDKETLGACCV